ncbi:hypothetical protein D3C87_952000 [compost metagenome]
MSGSSARIVPSAGAVMRAEAASLAMPVSSANSGCSVPCRNHSLRAASSGLPSAPGPKLTRASTSPAGGAGARLGSRACRKRITSAHTGAAPLVPLTSHIEAPLALPTHTPTV